MLTTLAVQMTEDQQPMILIADDHAIFRAGLRSLIEIEPDFVVVGEASDGAEAVELVREHDPDVLLLDLAMPRVTGIEALRQLADEARSVRTILLTATIDKTEVLTALRLGARGIVLKESATQLLFKSVRTVMTDQYWIRRGTVGDLVTALAGEQETGATGASASGYRLTHREREIVSFVVAGHANKEIANQCSVSEATVKHHLTHIFDKVGVSTRLELAVFATHNKLVEP